MVAFGLHRGAMRFLTLGDKQRLWCMYQAWFADEGNAAAGGILEFIRTQIVGL
jgi:hypothetical protein